MVLGRVRTEGASGLPDLGSLLSSRVLRSWVGAVRRKLELLTLGAKTGPQSALPPEETRLLLKSESA